MASGDFVTISSVSVSIARYDAIEGMRDLPCADWRGSYCGLSVLRSLSKFQTADLAVNSDPSWKCTPGRILKIQCVFVVSAGSSPQLVARPGTRSDGLVALVRSQLISAS